MKQREVLTLLLAILAGTLLAGLFAPKALQFFGYNGMTIEDIVARPEASAGRALLLGQALYTLLMFALPGLYLMQRWREKPLVPALPKGSWSWIDRKYCSVPMRMWLLATRIKTPPARRCSR